MVQVGNRGGIVGECIIHHTVAAGCAITRSSITCTLVQTESNWNHGTVLAKCIGRDRREIAVTNKVAGVNCDIYQVVGHGGTSIDVCNRSGNRDVVDLSLCPRETNCKQECEYA